MDSGRNSDNVERLASKYMRKCKVESSTDSESDVNNEGIGTAVSIPTTHVDVEKMDFQKLQFLDPYDGDFEDAIQSSSSECDQKSTVDDDQGPCALRDNSVGMDCGLISISDPQSEGCDLISYSNSNEKMTTPWQSLEVSNSPNKSVAFLTRSSELSVDSGMLTEDLCVTSRDFLLTGQDSRVETSTSPLFPTSLTSEENSDFTMFETSLIKRKWGMRTEAEKMRRKKPRLSEYMAVSYCHLAQIQVN
ncbi:uncharacterized protein RB166_014753 [Leptodactylus fuscus]